MPTPVEIEYQRLKNLVSLKGKSDEELRKRAEEIVRKRQLDSEFLDNYKDPEEIKLAKELVYKYLNDYQIESISDRNNLKEVIRLEVIQNRLHFKLNETYEETNKALSLSILKAIQENGEAIRKMKDALGLNKSKEKLQSYDAFQHFKRRAKVWMQEHQMSLIHKCPSCQSKIWFKLRNEIWEARKHPFFKDNMIYNTALFEKYFGKTVEINEKFIADVLGTSEDFPRWVIEKRRGKVNVQTQSEEQSGSIQEPVQLLESEVTQTEVHNQEGQPI